MNRNRTRLSAALLTLLFLLFSGFPAFAEGGNGDGSGDGGGRETPLTLASSSVPNGAENVDPNVQIVLTFTKNVVHFNVKENNMKCFSVQDSKGNGFPIRVIMGDDQVDPDVKRIVTIEPQSPYKAGETYLLTIHRGLTAKNEENILEKDVYLSFTIREQTTTHAYVRPSPDSPTTTTTKKAETTTKRVATTRPPITAATRPTATTTTIITETAAIQTSELTETTVQQQTATLTVSHAAFSEIATTAVYATSVPTAETSAETVPASELKTPEEATAESESYTTSAETETEAKANTGAETTKQDKRLSPAICIGIIIATVGTITIISIIKTKKKKG